MPLPSHGLPPGPLGAGLVHDRVSVLVMVPFPHVFEHGERPATLHSVHPPCTATGGDGVVLFVVKVDTVS